MLRCPNIRVISVFCDIIYTYILDIATYKVNWCVHISPSPAEPGYTLPLLTVYFQISWLF